MSKVIAVFGSARVDPGDFAYDESYKIGKTLGEAGYDVITGGYDGVMDAASKGAKEAGTHVIGVTVRELEAYRESRVNPYVMEEIKYDTLRERLHHLIDNSDAYIIMPGGIGTLQELVDVWQLMRMNHVTRKPIICYGDYWINILTPMMETTFLSPTDKDLLQLVNTPEETLAILKDYFKE